MGSATVVQSSATVPILVLPDKVDLSQVLIINSYFLLVQVSAILRHELLNVH